MIRCGKTLKGGKVDGCLGSSGLEKLCSLGYLFFRPYIPGMAPQKPANWNCQLAQKNKNNNNKMPGKTHSSWIKKFRNSGLREKINRFLSISN